VTKQGALSPRWLVLDAMPITQMDVTGHFVVDKPKAALRQKALPVGRRRPGKTIPRLCRKPQS